ncbi:C6 zinc finger domain protein [Colletotrichum truncatum]|uniref:C6 zinc finger domain protein n=1 Tax=Colletotrichum truncatum TaxID=5467 RepID=A0ACC3YPK7_COLTU|nr:C6 zinc finger domain protein [Colletotrichum truncatum]KAF6784235.1 C6 zinc finger domain protein [Colletotrichum truncatum]
MVGVPGRSKGCNTCRKRKKGCDVQRPECGQCLKAGLKCEGYERKRIFVNVTNPAASKSSKTAALIPVIPSIVQVASLSRSAYEEKILDMFWEGFMPNFPICSLENPIMRYSHAEWAVAVKDLYTTDAVLRQSLLSISLGTIGRRDEQKWMIDEGLKFYCQALSQMNSALRHPARWKSDAIMMASRLLGFYELLYGADDRERRGISQAQSWEGHVMGELALVVQRTPESHIDGHAHLLFSSGRMPLAISHIKQRRRCPLSQPVWKTVPWQYHPKSAKDSLVDIFVDIPGILEDLDLFRSCDEGPEKEERQKKLIRECWRIDAELMSWLDSLSPQEEFKALEARGLENPTTCDVVVASAMCLFWTTCILAYSTLRMAFGPNPGVELPERTNPRIYCTKIANMVDVLFHPAAGTYGIQSAPLPIGMSLVYLNSTEEGFNSQEKKKLVSFFGKRANNGIAIGKFLVSTQRDGIVPRGAAQSPTPEAIKAKAIKWIGAVE